MGRSKTCFSSTVVCSDTFNEMPQSTQLLYYRLAFESDGYGVVANVRSVMKVVGAKDDDLGLLIDRGFLIPVLDCYVIRHFFINNNRDSMKNMGVPTRSDVMDMLGGFNSKTRVYELSGGNPAEVRRKSGGSPAAINRIERNGIEINQSIMTPCAPDDDDDGFFDGCLGRDNECDVDGQTFSTPLAALDHLYSSYGLEPSELHTIMRERCGSCDASAKKMRKCYETVYQLLNQNDVRNPGGLMVTCLQKRRGW